MTALLPREMGVEGAARYLNRELGVLEFNRRVLHLADDPNVPLLERLRFLCIVSSNLDEFFEIRVAGLKAQVELGTAQLGPDEQPPARVLERVAESAHALVRDQYALWNERLVPALAREGVRFIRRREWTAEQREWIRDYFQRDIFPVLTPIGLDPAHPFPRIYNKSLNFAVQLAGEDDYGRVAGIALVQAPRVLPRVVELPSHLAGTRHSFVMLSSIIHAHVGELFRGMQMRGCYQFRVTRNSDLFVDEEEIANLRLALESGLRQRHFGDAVRLEVVSACPEELSTFLLGQFGLGPADLYRVDGPVNLVRLMQVPDRVDRPDLKYPTFTPGTPRRLARKLDVFATLRKGDVLLHHPFESFRPVISFIEQAAEDPAVVAIKQTVYRTGVDSDLMRVLLSAARRGKEVTVVVELLARFDEETNIHWARELEEVGAHVVYGVVGFKTHAKLALVVRREGEQLARYCHIGTGNYNTRTASLYTDFSLLTCDEQVCADVNDVFLQLTGLGTAGALRRLWQSPFTFHHNLVQAIRHETEMARAKQECGITAKMNSLLEPQLIDALYEASRAGVPIDLIVRGVCGLRPGVPGLSETIRVRSIVGRFLEHHRVFRFHSTGAVFISSGDWMPRNFFRRIEVALPILDPELRRRVTEEGLDIYLRDNSEAWQMTPTGSYVQQSPNGEAPRSAQKELIEQLAQRPTPKAPKVTRLVPRRKAGPR